MFTNCLANGVNRKLMEIRDDLIIHQSLHGYSNGHNLLATSISLSPIDEKLMLILSDMSGPSMTQGFESYLTGYPLLEVKKYVIARTWYAPEMSRPGCVWTHSLIIDFQDISSINDLNRITEFFARPQKDALSSDYKKPIKTNRDSFSDYKRINKNISIELSSVSNALYGSPSQPIFIPVFESEEINQLFFAIWELQWPRLRRSFSFCTGSIANRNSNSIIFDIQAFPRKYLDKYKRESKSGIFVDNTNTFTQTGMNENTLFDFSRIFTQDAFNFKNSLIDFIDFTKFGADFANGRGAYLNLCNIYVILQEINERRAPINELTRYIHGCYPGTQEAITLKKELYGYHEDEHSPLMPSVPESIILKEICTTKYLSMIDTKVLNIRKRAQDLWNEYPNEAKQFTFDLLDSESSPAGIEFLLGISEIIQTNDFLDLFNTDQLLPQIFLVFRPELATSNLLWQVTPNKQREMFKRITSVEDLSDSLIKEITLAILQSDSDIVVRDWVDKYEDKVIYTFLNFIDTQDYSNSLSFSKTWIDVLKSKPEVLLKWIELPIKDHIKSQAFITTLLTPSSKEILRVGAKIWIPFSEYAVKMLKGEILIDSMAFILTIGLSNPGEGADILVARAFEIVHDAESKNSLKYKHWYYLNELLPNVYWWQEWDKCERLRKGLVDAFIEFNWPYSSFILALQNIELFLKVLDYCDKQRSTRGYIRDIYTEIKSNKINISKEQESIIRKFYNSQ